MTVDIDLHIELLTADYYRQRDVIAKLEAEVRELKRHGRQGGTAMAPIHVSEKLADKPEIQELMRKTNERGERFADLIRRDQDKTEER